MHWVIIVVHIVKYQDGSFVENILITFIIKALKSLVKAAIYLWSHEKSTKGISDDARKGERVSSGLKLQSSCLI